MILILGCSGVGKSTIIKEIKSLEDHWVVLEENVNDVLEPLRNMSFSSPYEKFITTQERFLERDILELNQGSRYSLFDNRLTEYIFYLLHHPDYLNRIDESRMRLNSIIERILGDNRVRSFYLSDSITNIESRVKSDHTRSRNFWSYFMEHLFPFHEEWHSINGARVIPINDRNPKDIAVEILNAL
ncbi:AAA family ATPase [Reinekea sp. G2M2-21]|uniref:AAA family ATPase n=1 Tax=Reinekea sp. G2M2-21 TaxID=2788942 RepID=UPI0018A911FE|nr:AAA family ATPase [Reinekea sp. G2M2-21]